MDYGNACAAFNEAEITELSAIAITYREAGGLVIKLSGYLGDKVEDVMRKVPESWQKGIGEAAELALRSSYLAAASSHGSESSDSYLDRMLSGFQGERWHKIAASVSGAIGGAGGWATLAADLAATTTLILRSIQQIAAGYGEDIEDEAVRLQCLSVFGFGGPLTEDDEVETGLFGVRVALALDKTLETVVKAVLPRFVPVVSEKMLAQAAPVLGAVAGAAINPIFTGYYQQMAHVNFRLRRLERQHETEQVRACFERIVRAQRERGTKG